MTQNHILWAIDPFATDKSLQRTAGWAIKALAKAQDATIEPVYVMPRIKEDLPLEVRRELIKQTQQAAQEGFDEIARRLKMKSIGPVSLIEQPGKTTKDKVRSLLNYAKDHKASLIVASTRARKGPARWFIGSFAETLAMHADVPLMTVNPSWDRRSEYTRILFPTDFTDESHAAFRKLLAFSKKFGTRVTLFHQVAQDSYGPGWSLAINPYPPLIDLFREEAKFANEESKKWVAEGAASGVKVEAVIDIKSRGSVADSILKHARKSPCWIAMGSQSGSLAAALLGSTTRRILRESECPIWILRSDALEKSQSAFNLTEQDVLEELQFHGRKEKTA